MNCCDAGQRYCTRRGSKGAVLLAKCWKFPRLFFVSIDLNFRRYRLLN